MPLKLFFFKLFPRIKGARAILITFVCGKVCAYGYVRECPIADRDTKACKQVVHLLALREIGKRTLQSKIIRL